MLYHHTTDVTDLDSFTATFAILNISMAVSFLIYSRNSRSVYYLHGFLVFFVKVPILHKVSIMINRLSIKKPDWIAGLNFNVFSFVMRQVVDNFYLIVGKKIRQALFYLFGNLAKYQTDFLFSSGISAHFNHVAQSSDVYGPADCGSKAYGGNAAHG